MTALASDLTDRIFVGCDLGVDGDGDGVDDDDDDDGGCAFSQHLRQHGMPFRHTNSTATSEHSSHIRQSGWKALPSGDATITLPTAIVFSHHIHSHTQDAGTATSALDNIVI